jgi:chromosomal replication initiator protein
VADNDTDIVSTFRARLADQLGRPRYDLWFGTNTSVSLTAEALEIQVPNKFFHDWLKSNFRRQIEAACREALGHDVPLVFCVDESQGGGATGEPCVESPRAATAESCQASAQTVSDRAAPAILSRPRIQSPQPSLRRRKFAKLSGFVTGDSNKLAFTSAELAARKLGSISPLLIHGPTGVGKTHLLEGIYSEVRRRQPHVQAVYLSAEQFTTFFLEALRGSGLPSFRRKYRGVELLLIEDIQFFAGKRATLVELLHTIDTLLRDGFQLVLSADRPPDDLAALGPELTTRLQGGMVCGMEPPERSVRLGIVQHLALQREMQVPVDVQEYIADNLTAHARELAGALNLLEAARLARREPVSRQMAEDVLTDAIRRGSRQVRLADIEKAVCETLGLEADSLQQTGRLKRINHARMLAMWLARKHTRAALSEIGRHFGRRSHTTVISAQKKVDGWMHDHAAVDLADRHWNVEDAIRRVEQNLKTG